MHQIPIRRANIPFLYSLGFWRNTSLDPYTIVWYISDDFGNLVEACTTGHIVSCAIRGRKE